MDLKEFAQFKVAAALDDSEANLLREDYLRDPVSTTRINKLSKKDVARLRSKKPISLDAFGRVVMKVAAATKWIDKEAELKSRIAQKLLGFLKKSKPVFNPKPLIRQMATKAPMSNKLAPYLAPGTAIPKNVSEYFMRT